MNTHARQEGMTMWGLVSIVLIGVFFMFLFFKLLPPYMEDIKVGSAVSRVAKKPGIGGNPEEIRESLRKMFDIENISNIDLNKDIEIQPRGNTAATIKISYEREIPMTKNISVLMYFDHQADTN